MSHTTAMPSITPPQDIYARLLSCSRGYPLWTPEPSNELLMERRDGLRIGDVGVVLEDGGVDVLFNLCLPADHPFHRHGVPQGFTCINPNLLDIRTVANAEPPGYVIPSSSVTFVKTSGSSNTDLERHTSNTLPYRFNLSSSEGAVLVLPKGAERYDLLNEELFLEQARQHGAAWYHYAVDRRGRIISSDSLYLITGVHKTLSWSVAVLENTSLNEHHTTYFRQIQRDNRPPTYSWEVTGNCALEWRIAPDTGPHIEYSIPNQAVFIRGLKIAIRIGLLGNRWISVETDTPSARSKNIKLSSLVPGNTSMLGRFAGFLSSSGSAYLPATTRSEGTINADEERPQSSVMNRGGYDGTQVKIQRVPDVSRPFHPSDVINQYLLEKDPSANIAITHDNHWMSLLENMSLTPNELVDGSSVKTAISQTYRTVSRDGVVYLERKLEQSSGGPSASTSKYIPAPAMSPRSSSSLSNNAFNSSFSDEDSKLLAGHYASLASQPQHCYHQCYWVVSHATCNMLILGHEFSEHLRAHHFPAGTDKTQVRCCWAGCSSDVKKERLMRHVQEKHLEWKYTCPNCFERFTRSYTRDQHIARKHSN